MFRTIWQALVSIDRALEVSANTDIETMSDVSRSLMDGLWILALAGLVVMAAVYASLEYVILRPVAQVTKALKLEAAGDSDFPPPTGSLARNAGSRRCLYAHAQPSAFTAGGIGALGDP